MGCNSWTRANPAVVLSWRCALALAAATVWLASSAQAADFWVAPTGSDDAPGTRERPWATLHHAQNALRQLAPHGTPATVHLRGGVYYLALPLRFKAEDSGTPEAPRVYRAADGEEVVLSGGVRLDLRWTTFREGILEAKTPDGLVMDQLFVNGERLPMARHPNYDPTVRHFNGYAADAISPERTARWPNPTGGYVHAMHAFEWGDMHWRIRAKKPDGTLDLEGGWQNNRPSPMHRTYRFVENVFEELDARGEWYHDATRNVLYCRPPDGTDLNQAVIEAVRLRHLVEFDGSRKAPVRFLALHGLTFRHAARTFMENKEGRISDFSGGIALVNDRSGDCGTGQWWLVS